MDKSSGEENDIFVTSLSHNVHNAELMRFYGERRLHSRIKRLYAGFWLGISWVQPQILTSGKCFWHSPMHYKQDRTVNL